MSTIGNTYYDLIDLYNQTDETMQFASIIELLKQHNPILEDAIAIECNKGTKHATTVRTGLPTVTWGKLYQGIPQSKSQTAGVEDTTGFVEGLSTVDKRLLKLSGNEGAIRLSEADAFLEAISQEVATRMFYGNSASDPEMFMGLAPRFNDLTAANGGQIVDAGGTGDDNTSIWFIGWGDRQVHTLYPKGMKGGIEREDKGEQRVLDANGNPYYVKEELFTQHIGLTVRDWRYVVRIANIDVSALQAGNFDIYKYMRKAFWKLKSHRITGGRIAIYGNSDVMEALDGASTPTMSTNATWVRLTPKEVDGMEVSTYRGMPVRQVDAIVNTEERVVNVT